MNKTTLQFWSSYLGNFFEHYDNAIFGFLSPFLAPLIFPDHDPLTALILTYALMPLGMLGRPIGALIFGYIGDVYGRARALFLTLAGMSIVSMAIAFCPTHAQVGILSPLIFVIARILQNVFAAGETMGGAVYLLDSAAIDRHDVLSGLYSTSAMGGIILASAGVGWLSANGNIESHWRWLYIVGSVTGIFGCMIRKSSISKEPSESVTQQSHSIAAIWMACRESWQALLIVTCVSGFAYSGYSIALIFTTGFIPLITTVTKEQLAQLNTWLLILDACALPLFGWVCSKLSRRFVMLAACTAVIAIAMPLCQLLQGATFTTVVMVRSTFVIIGVAFFAPFHAWAYDLVPTGHRYLIISLGYALGTQLFGGPSSTLSLWFYQKSQLSSAIAWYWVVMAMAAAVGIVLSWNRRDSLQSARL